MFETSVVRTRAASSRRAGLLTASVAAHTLVIFGSVAVGLASVDFPKQAPAEYQMAPSIPVVQIPPPLGDPNGGARPQPQPERQQTPPPPPNQVTAPNIVPDDVMPEQPNATEGTGTSEGQGEGPGLVPGPVGVPWGDPNSIANDLNAPPVIAAPPPAQDRIYDAREVTAPVIIKRIEPRYPQAMLKVSLSATVVVRCIIDKEGNVRDPQVLVSSMPPFNAAVIDAVEQWKFRPGMLNGQPVNTYLELKVRFEARR